MRRLLFAAVLAFATGASAHDFWIEPATFRPRVGETFAAALRVGQDFDGDAVPRSAELIDAFVVRQGSDERAVPGLEGRDPAGIVRLERNGLAIIGYRSKPYPLELPAEKFEKFLAEERLERVAALRRQRGETAKPDRERFFRFAKAFVLAGSDDSGFDRRLGYRYELIPETSPHTSKRLVVRALLQGKPLAGAFVTAIRSDGTKFFGRTAKDGRVSFELPAGVWLVKSVEMVPAPARSGVEWESLWASMVFSR